MLLKLPKGKTRERERERERERVLGGIQLLPHPAYSPDLAPFDYICSGPWIIFCGEETSSTSKIVKDGISKFFMSKIKTGTVMESRP